MLLAGVAQAGTIDFDTIAAGPLSDAFNATDGVEFSTVTFDSVTRVITDVADHVVVVASGDAITAPNAIGAVSVGSDDVSQNSILIEFFVAGTQTIGTTDQVSIRLDRLDSVPPPPTDQRDDAVLLFALDVNNNILGVATSFDTSSGLVAAGTLSVNTGVSNIARAVVKFIPAPNSADTELYDDLTFGDITPIPEPASGMLALLGIGFLVRRKSRRVA
jgi:hypothetical protein